MKAKCDVIRQSFGGVCWKIKDIVARHYSSTQTNREISLGVFQCCVRENPPKKVSGPSVVRKWCELMRKIEGEGKK